MTGAGGQPVPGLAGSHAFVDLETTGCDPVHDRIIEIAVITVDDGRVVDEWSSLVDPERPIPPTVQGLTGIDDAMVADAPTFTSLREEILERLRGRTLVAHNARFDYGFLRNAFAREGVGFRAPVLCTLKLARRLYPKLGRHGLDRLIEAFDLGCDARHRALGDTRATVGFVARAGTELGEEALAAAVARQGGGPAQAPALPDGALDGLPAAPGVYLFFASDDTLLYVGKSTDLQRRVPDHFSGDHRTRRAAELAQLTARIDWIETPGELGALLREARLVKERRPLYNRRLREMARHALVSLQEGPDGYLYVSLLDAAAPEARPGDAWYGPFGDRRAAKRHLKRVAEDERLCPARLGLESARPGRPCFARQVGRCAGACTGEEPAAAFNLRLLEALAPKRIEPWPWSGPVAVRERNEAAAREEVHVIDRWRYVGSARDPEEVAGLAEAASDAPFDRDHYRLLHQWLRRHPRSVRPIEARGVQQALSL